MKNQSQHKLATISYVEVNANDTIDLWPRVITIDYQEASEIGRDRAMEILRYAGENQAPMVLGHVAAAIIGKGDCGPAERAFFHEIAVQSLPEATKAEQKADTRPPSLQLVHSI